MQVAHSFKEKSRTGDVLISEDVDFSGLLLSVAVLNGLHSSGFVRPSPIQLKAIPLGRCGLDLIVQAKSGTGKTCVFSVIALESIATDTVSTQVLVLAPTREIAVQIWEVINSIGSAISGLACHTFIGGLPVPEDRVKLRKCHIAVGSPGRIKQLIECGALKTDSIRLFVLDEADKLLEESFQEQINWIYSTLPDNKQMLALSATYPEYLAKQLTHYMRNPTYLRLNITDPALLGIRQYHKTVPYHAMAQKVFEYKSEALTHILSSISFQQCLVFSNLQTRAQTLADSLVRCGWPTACIAGRLDQKDRNEAMAKLKTYKCRILISTDLTSRGIDADKVNLVINLDVPKDHETYLHRIGRAGRFGAFGIAITLVSEGQEMLNLNALEKRCNTQIRPVPDPIPSDLAKAESPVSLDDVVSTQVLHTDKLQANMSNNQVTEFGSKIETMSADVPNISQTDEGQTKATINDGQHTQIVKDRSSTFFQNPTDINGYMDTTDFSKMNGHTSPKDSVIGNITNAKHQAINLENENATVKNEDDNKENQNITQGSQAVKKDETIKPADQKHLDQSINTGVSFDLGSPCKEFIIEGRSSTNAVAEDESDSSLESADDNTDEKQLFSYSATNSVVLSRDVSTGFELNLASDEKQRLSGKVQTKKRKKEICEKVKERIDMESNCQIHSLKEDTKYTGQRNYDSEVYRKLDTNKDYEYNTNRLSLQKLKVNVPDIFKKNIKYKPKQKYYTYQAGMLSLKAFCDNKESENGDKAYHPNLCLNGVDDKSEETLELQEAVKNLLDQFDINFKLGRNEMNRTQQRQRKVTFSLSAEENEDMGPVSTDQVVKNVVIESMTELSNTKCTEEIIMESEKSKTVNKEHGKKKIISQSAKDLKNREGYSKYKEECNETSTKNKGFQKKTKSSASKIVDYKGKFAIGHLLSQEREYFVNESQNTKSPSDGPHKAETGHKIKHNAENKSSLERPNENQLLIAPSGIQGKEYCVKDQHSAVTGDIGTRADQSCSNRKTYNPVDLTINRNKSRYRHSSSSINREEVRDSDVRESQHSSSEFSEDSSSDSDSISSSSEEYAVPKISKHGRAHKHDKYKYSDSARYTNNRKDKKTENCNSQTYCNTWLLHNSSQEQHPHQSNKMFPTFNEQYSYSHHHQSQGPIYYRPAKHTSPYNQQAYPNYGQQYLRQPDQYLYQPQYMLPWQHHYGKRYYPYSTYNQNYPSHGFYFPVQPAQDRKSYEDNLEAAYRMQRDYIQKMSKFPS